MWPPSRLKRVNSDVLICVWQACRPWTTTRSGRRRRRGQRRATGRRNSRLCTGRRRPGGRTPRSPASQSRPSRAADRATPCLAMWCRLCGISSTAWGFALQHWNRSPLQWRAAPSLCVSAEQSFEWFASMSGLQQWPWRVCQSHLTALPDTEFDLTKSEQCCNH
jgi:hypothetical protein